MRNLLVVFFSLAATTALAAEGWLTDYDAALAKAKETKKPVLAVFSGSDWCPPCMMLEKEILSSKEFLDAMKGGSFVPLFLDFPRHKKMLATQKEKNHAIAKKFSIEAFPTVLLLNTESKVLAKEEGLAWRTPKDLLDWIQKNKK